MKAWAMFTSFAGILWSCASATAQHELNTTCKLFFVYTPQLEKTLLQYFEKSSEIKLLEYVLVFSNGTNQMNSTENGSSITVTDLRFFRTQEFGSLYFLFMDEYFWTFRCVFGIIKSKVELYFRASPGCLGDKPSNSQINSALKVLTADFGFIKELQNDFLQVSNKVQYCLNDNSGAFFKHYRCCSINKWSEIHCNDHSVNLEKFYFSVPFIVSFFIALYILYLTTQSYSSIVFTCYTEAETQIDDMGKIEVLPDIKSNTLKKIPLSMLMKMNRSSWPMIGYYINKIKENKCCNYFWWFPYKNTPSILTMFLEFCVLTIPFIILCIERFMADDPSWGIAFAVMSAMNFLVFIIFCFVASLSTEGIQCLLKVYFKCEKRAVYLEILHSFVWFFLFIVFYCSILFYVKLIFVLISFIFFEFEKSDVYVSLIIVVFIYVYDFCKKHNVQFRRCLTEFEQAFDKMIIENRHKKTIKITLLVESSESETTEEKINGLAVFCDKNKNMYFVSKLYYDCCKEYFKKPSQSKSKIIGAILAVTVLICYIMMLGILVLHFDSHNEYSVGKTVFMVISAGMLPKVLAMVSGILSNEVHVQKRDTRFLGFVENKIIRDYGIVQTNTENEALELLIEDIVQATTENATQENLKKDIVQATTENATQKNLKKGIVQNNTENEALELWMEEIVQATTENAPQENLKKGIVQNDTENIALEVWIKDIAQINTENASKENLKEGIVQNNTENEALKLWMEDIVQATTENAKQENLKKGEITNYQKSEGFVNDATGSFNSVDEVENKVRQQKNHQVVKDLQEEPNSGTPLNTKPVVKYV